MRDNKGESTQHVQEEVVEQESNAEDQNNEVIEKSNDHWDLDDIFKQNISFDDKIKYCAIEYVIEDFETMIKLQKICCLRLMLINVTRTELINYKYPIACTNGEIKQ